MHGNGYEKYVLYTDDQYKKQMKDLEKVGVYGYVNDALSSESVLANNPDSGTDAGQFAMIESVTTKDKKIEFEFIAAVPMEKVRVDVSRAGSISV